MSSKPQQPKARSYVAISAQFQSGSGKHGGNKRQVNRNERKAARQSLKRGNW